MPEASKFDPQVFLATLDGDRTISRYEKYEVVFAQGHLADAVFYIRSGKIKIVVNSEQGKEAVVGILATRDFFGEGCLIGQPLRLASARTITSSSIMRIEKAGMMRVLRDEPLFADRFMKHLLTRNSRVEEDLVDQLFNSSEKRLARLLLLLANVGKDDPPELVATKISQETLAEMIGTTRSSGSWVSLNTTVSCGSTAHCSAYCCTTEDVYNFEHFRSPYSHHRRPCGAERSIDTSICHAAGRHSCA